jgi:hypothetical protein
MKSEAVILFLLSLPLSCQKEADLEGSKLQVSFYLSITNFELKDTLLHKFEQVPDISHQFTGGKVRFSNSRKTYLFDTRGTSIDEYLFTVPEGDYYLEIEMPGASLYGQNRATFKAESKNIEISNLTDTITVSAKPTCALIVVKDNMDQLTNGAFIIQRHEYPPGYFIPYPLTLDSLSRCYYAYLTPDTVTEFPSAFLWFYDEKQGNENEGLTTKDFEIGYRYLIKVLE